MNARNQLALELYQTQWNYFHNQISEHEFTARMRELKEQNLILEVGA